MPHKSKLLIMSLAIAVLSGCSSVPLAPKEFDAAAKQFRTTAGESNLYIYRHEVYGDDRVMPVALDGKAVGMTTSGTFILQTVPPGSHSIRSQDNPATDLKIDTVAGKNYYVWIEVVTGLVPANSVLHQVDETTGQPEVARCKLVQ